MAILKSYEGGCLCGAVRFQTDAAPVFPHLCSCAMCRRWSGAPTLAWVEFPISSFQWTGSAGEPKLFRTSMKTRRGTCPSCASAICAIDDGYDHISIVIGALDRPNMVVPDERHSYRTAKPKWWRPDVQQPPKTPARKK